MEKPLSQEIQKDPTPFVMYDEVEKYWTAFDENERSDESLRRNALKNAGHNL